MKKYIMLMLFAAVSLSIYAGYKPGDKAADFKLKKVDGRLVSMGDYKDSMGFVIAFTCNHCPYAQAYQDRLIDIANRYRSKGISVIAINPNDPSVSPEDSFDEMKKRSDGKKYPFPYLMDVKQEVYKIYGAERTPHIFLVSKRGGEYIVEYIGAIDDNYKDAAQVTQPYLESAIEAVLAGKSPEPNFTKAIGCSIKTRQP
jgi:peroxiredoxin